MAPRFSRPRLVDASDRQYREHVARIMMTKDNHRPTRPPSARELFGGESEEALRGWLSQRYSLSDRRLIEYLEHRGRSALKKYRELDAVVIDGSAVQIFEIKASERATSVRRAARQLHDSAELLRMLYRSVQTTILLVDTGIPKTADDVAEIMAQEDAPSQPPATLDEVLAILPNVRDVATLDQRAADPTTTSLIRFSVEDIIALVGEEHLHLDWDADDMLDQDAEEPEAEATPTEQDPALNDEDNSAFAEALRKAMEQGNKRR